MIFLFNWVIFLRFQPAVNFHGMYVSDSGVSFSNHDIHNLIVGPPFSLGLQKLQNFGVSSCPVEKSVVENG